MLESVYQKKVIAKYEKDGYYVIKLAKTIKIVQNVLDDTYIHVYNESCGQDAHTF